MILWKKRKIAFIRIDTRRIIEKVYEILKIFGFLIRQFLLPNPFESICPERALLVNLIFGIILMPIAYFIVGSFYDRHCDGPAVGSFMFNLVYIGLTLVTWGLLVLFNWICDNWIVVLICTSIVVVVMIIVVIIYKKKKHTSTKREKSSEKTE